MAHFTTTDGVRIYYESHGTGDPLLLAYGIGGNAGMWQPNVHALSARHRLILWEPRGHARSESPADPAKVTFLSESISGPYAQVRSRITTERRIEISIDYRLRDTGTRWVVYDVVLDGVSLVSNYRSQFNSIIRTSSFADLLTKLRNKEIAAHVVPRIGRGGS
jgi:pimeloyl-ACP methyl ester carboxylesterase